jgi:hypothetical protein
MQRESMKPGIFCPQEAFYPDGGFFSLGRTIMITDNEFL